MKGLESEKNLELKVVLRDVNLLGLLHAADNSCNNSSTLNKKDGRGDLLVSFLTENDSFNITGLFKGRFPLNFRVKPGSQSYFNLMRFLHSELSREISDQATFCQQTALGDDKIRSLVSHLERRLTRQVSPKSAGDTSTTEETRFFQCDFELGAPALASRGPAVSLHKNIEVTSRQARNRSTERTASRSSHQFCFFNGAAQKPILISGFVSLEIEETGQTVSTLKPGSSLQARPPEAAAAPAAVSGVEARRILRAALDRFDTLSAAILDLERRGYTGSISQHLHELTRRNKKKRSHISRCHRLAKIEMIRLAHGDSQEDARKVFNALENIGIGETVLISPEGPHAIAGGLAQVIVGLMRSLTRRGIPVTLITPLYEEWFGNKHKSADALLKEGLRIYGRTVPIRKIGEVPVHFGPTHQIGSSWWNHWPHSAQASVYAAQEGRAKIIFVRHPYYTSRLYKAGYADDQLKRSIFLSRSALEILREPAFAINPQTVVTNDWHAGLTGILLRTDQRYLQDDRLQALKSIHILHNCGEDYQGRLKVLDLGHDIYPLMGIGGEHFFGLQDPAFGDCINITAGAVRHTTDALVTVSRPYAQQLTSDGAGVAMGGVFRSRGDRLFGISNGIDLDALRRTFWSIGETARAELGLPGLYPFKFSRRKMLRYLPHYKSAVKLLVQKRYGLKQNAGAMLFSFVSRVAEQKGIKLFTEHVWDESIPVLESILRRHPEAQILVGGPPVEGDQAAGWLRHVVWELGCRYPGRIAGYFDFLPHRDALAITLGSDLFLMPSRFEPGGITQLEALAAGTPVVARNVGGIAATLQQYSEENSAGNSFLFSDYSSHALRDTISWAMWIMNNPERRRKLIFHASSAHHDWNDRAHEYCALLQWVAGVLKDDQSYPHLRAKTDTVARLRP